MTREEARASIKKHLDLMYPYNTPKDVLKVAYEALGQQEIIRCKDCKHRPTKNLEFEQILEFPDGVCPCQNPDDDYYSWYPADDWYCADGEPKDGDSK